MTIPFNKPAVTGREAAYINEAITRGRLSGDGYFTQKCEAWLADYTGSPRVLMTASCTQALEMAAVLIDIEPGDEVIMPSYTFTSTANAFVLRGARIIFIDVDPGTMNIDETLIEAAVTPSTKAIVVVHYAGVAAEMADIMKLAEKHGLYVIEDAAQGLMSSYCDQAVGAIGHLGTFSFHETKNYTGGEGGALVINDPKFIKRAEIIREKGTNRRAFMLGEVDKYSWVDLGSSFLPSELSAAYLYAQLEQAGRINEERLAIWHFYEKGLKNLEEKGALTLPRVPEGRLHNAHMFYIKTNEAEDRQKLIGWLKTEGISSAFHYLPLHDSKAGRMYGRFCGRDQYTTAESRKLLRLPLYYGLSRKEAGRVVAAILAFYGL